MRQFGFLMFLIFLVHGQGIFAQIDMPAYGPVDLLAFDPGGHTSGVCDVLFTPDEKLLISVGYDATIRFWRVESHESKTYRLPNLFSEVRVLCAAISPDGKMLAVAGCENTAYKREFPIFLISLISGNDDSVEWPEVVSTPSKRLETGHQGAITGLAFIDAGGQLCLVSSSHDGTVRIRDIQNDWDEVVFAHASKLSCVAASHDRIAAGSLDGMVLCHFFQESTDTNAEIAAMSNTLKIRAHDGPVTGVVLGSTQQLLASVGLDGKLNYWKEENLAAYSQIILGGAATSLRFCPQRESILLTGKECQILDIEFDKIGSVENSFLATCGAISASSKWIATAGETGELNLQRIGDGKNVTLSGAGQPITDVRWNSNGLIWTLEADNERSGDSFRKWQIFDFASFKIKELVEDPKEVSSVQPSGKKLILDDEAKLLVSGSENSEVLCENVTCFSWIDDRYIAVGISAIDDIPCVRILDIVSKEIHGKLIGNFSTITSIAVSPDRRFVAAASKDRTIRVWFWKPSLQNFFQNEIDPLLTFFPNSEQWLMWLPNGKFASSSEFASHYLGVWRRQLAKDCLMEFQHAEEGDQSSVLREARSSIELMVNLLFVQSAHPNAYIKGFVENDQQQLGSKFSHVARYFTFSHQWLAGLVSSVQIERNGRELSLAVNSLSWSPKIVPLVSIDPSGTIFRLNLEDYQYLSVDSRGQKVIAKKWDAKWWSEISRDYPYYDIGILELISSSRKVPPEHILRGDWFLSEQSAPKYYELISIPRTAQRLERILQVDRHLDHIEDGRTMRVAVLQSAVGPGLCFRLLERREIPTTTGLYSDWNSKKGSPAYWKSYDFDSFDGNRNLLTHPCGPGADEGSFRHDGSEVIFNLPNGLLAFAVYDQTGSRWNTSPILSGAKHLEADLSANPITPVPKSCVECHLGGIKEKTDFMLDFVKNNPSNFLDHDVQSVLKLHWPKAVANQVIENDRAVFELFKNEAFGGFTDYSRTRSPLELYNEKLSVEAAAAELSVSEEELLHILQKPLNKSSVALISDSALIPRKLFRNMFLEIGEALSRNAP